MEKLHVFGISVRIGVRIVAFFGVGTQLLARDEPYGRGPGGKKVGGGDEFRRCCRQEGPVPSEETNHHEGDDQVEH